MQLRDVLEREIDSEYVEVCICDGIFKILGFYVRQWKICIDEEKLEVTKNWKLPKKNK